MERVDGFVGDDELEEITVLNEVGTFKNMMVWNHEDIVDGENVFVKGLSEWIDFAETVSHVFLECGRRHVHHCC